MLDLLDFEPCAYDLVVTGEGRVDVTTGRARSRRRSHVAAPRRGVPCVVFGGVVSEPLAGVETIALSGDPVRAPQDLVELGLRLGTRLFDAAR